MPFSGQICLPPDVLGLAPFDRGIGIWCNAGTQGTPPLWPKAFRAFATIFIICHHRYVRQREYCENRAKQSRHSPPYLVAVTEYIEHPSCVDEILIGPGKSQGRRRRIGFSRANVRQTARVLSEEVVKCDPQGDLWRDWSDRCRWSTVRGVVRRGVSLYLVEVEAHEIIPSWVIVRRMSRSVFP